ncbi:MAG: hypothetical protein ACXVKN_09620 [Acidimicrobiia bacterium]
MTIRTRTGLIGGVVVIAMLTMAMGLPAKTVPPKKWAKSVCTSITDWTDSAQQGAADLKNELKGSDVNLRQVRAALTSYLGDTVDATTEMLDGIKHAGTPATPKGKQAAAALSRGFDKARTSLRRLRDQAKDLSVNNQAAALVDIDTLQARVSKQFASLESTFKSMDHYDPGHKLSKAFNATRACRALSGDSSS